MPAQLENPALPTGAAASAAALVVSGLECQRGERPLFAGLDFTAHAGAIVWVRGANGRGKTTLLRTLAGLSAPSAGTIVRRGAAAGWKLLYLAHANALKEDLSVRESLAFLLRVHGDEPQRRRFRADAEREQADRDREEAERKQGLAASPRGKAQVAGEDDGEGAAHSAATSAVTPGRAGAAASSWTIEGRGSVSDRAR